MAEVVYQEKYNILNAIMLTTLLLFTAITMALMLFPVEAGFHDLFHEFRHALGIPCH